MAAALATALVFSVALWPQSVLTSLVNLATPWSDYLVPTLSANISPGDVTIAEGESVNIKVTATDDLDHSRLEIVRGDVVESHSMVATSPIVSTFTLTDVRQDAVYRIHSGGLFSVPHTITVHPQPQLTAMTAQLKFPDYTHLDPLTIERVTEPIVVPAGTEVTLTAMSDDVAARGAIRWNSEPREVIGKRVTDKGSTDSVQFEWTFIIEPETELVGTLGVRSELGVSSVPHPIAIRALDDSAPRIEITTPGLRRLTMRRDSDLPIRYRVIDDFGVSKAELMVKFGKQEPVARACPDPEVHPGDPRGWIGETSLGLPDVPADCHEVSLWLRIADNRPDEFGGAQVIESETIHITLDDRASSFGQQQILADRQMIEKSLERAIEQMREAQAASEALQDAQPLTANDPGIKADRPSARPDHIDALRRQTLKAKRTLEQLAKKLHDESNLFQPKVAEIQQVADREVKKALELANQIPLADNQLQQNELARGSGQQLASAIDQLDQIKSDIEQQAEQMEQAAQLDQLASKQERLARNAAEGNQDDAPDEQWRDRQEVIADDLQTLVEENEEARGQQLLQRAEEAERLAEQAQQLAQHQQQLEKVMRKAQQNNRKAEEAKQQLQDLIAAQKDGVNQQARQAAQRQGADAKQAVKDQEAEKKQKQRMDEAAKAAEEGDLDQAAAKIQEQISEQAEKMQQQAEQLAKENNPEPIVQERAKQAAEQLQQAKQKTDQAKKSLCEKCKGGGPNKPGEQNKLAGQDKPDGQNAKPDGQQPNGQNQGVKPQKQNPQQQPQGAAQPEDSGQQKQATKQGDAQINRDQQDAVRALQQASQTLNQVCQSCRECASCNEPGSSDGSKSGSSNSSGARKRNSAMRGPDSRAKQLVKASDGAKQAAQSPSKEVAAQNAKDVAEQLNQLADEAAQKSGYSLRQQKGSPKEQGKQQGNANKPGNNALSDQPGQPSGDDPQGVGNAAGDTNLNGQKLRGGSNSNWTRSRRKLGGGVLDDREGNVPEQYRGVVKRYFEQLSRQQSSREE